MKGTRHNGRSGKDGVYNPLHNDRRFDPEHSEHIDNCLLYTSPKQGKVTVKELAKQNAGMVNIEITDKNIKSFERYARKYGINYALKKDKSKDPPVYLVFFKGRDQDALNAAFREFSQKQIQKANKPSIHKRLAAYRAMMPKKTKDKVKNRHQEQSR